MLLAVLACLPVQSPPVVKEIQAHVGRTPWVVSIGLADWKEAPEGNPSAKPFGDKLVLNGSCAPEGTLLTLIAEPNTTNLSPAAWRKRLGVPGREFDCQLSACVDSSSRVEGGPTYSCYNAYTCAAGWCFDLHVSRLLPDDKDALAREAFENIVKSMRFLLLRRGWAEDYPSEISQQMTIAAMTMARRDSAIRVIDPDCIAIAIQTVATATEIAAGAYHGAASIPKRSAIVQINHISVAPC